MLLLLLLFYHLYKQNEIRGQPLIREKNSFPLNPFYVLFTKAGLYSSSTVQLHTTLKSSQFLQGEVKEFVTSGSVSCIESPFVPSRLHVLHAYILYVVNHSGPHRWIASQHLVRFPKRLSCMQLYNWEKIGNVEQSVRSHL